MAKELEKVYQLFNENNEAEQPIYDGAREEAVALLEQLLPEGTKNQADDIVSTTMGNAHRQGFYDGFRMASKLWAETISNQ
jgi:hypothetical protein